MSGHKYIQNNHKLGVPLVGEFIGVTLENFSILHIFLAPEKSVPRCSLPANLWFSECLNPPYHTESLAEYIRLHLFILLGIAVCIHGHGQTLSGWSERARGGSASVFLCRGMFSPKMLKRGNVNSVLCVF